MVDDVFYFNAETQRAQRLIATKYTKNTKIDFGAGALPQTPNTN